MTKINSLNQIVDFSYDAIRWLFTWSWQAMLVLTVGWISLKVDRSRNATNRFRVWLVAIVIVALLPLLNFIFRSLPAPVAPATFSIATSPVFMTTTGNSPISVSPQFNWWSSSWMILLGCWIVGVLVSMARFFRSVWKLRSLRILATPVSFAELNCSYSDVMIADSSNASIALSGQIKSPVLVGLFRPTILLPADLTCWTDSEERISILRHEMSHVKRLDHISCLIQSLLKSILFFHPMVRYSCSQLSLERELACDDTVLGLGTEPTAYAESILKAAERSLFTDFLHQTASFASRRKLERRIDMILDTTRSRVAGKTWRFFLLPVTIIGIVTWVIMPPASGRPRASVGIDASKTLTAQGQSVASIDKDTIWVDSVKRGSMAVTVRALGFLRSADNDRFSAELLVPSSNAKEIEIGQSASVDTGKGLVAGRVFRKHGVRDDGMVPVDISMDGDLPKGLHEGQQIDGLIEIGRLNDTLYLGMPSAGNTGPAPSLYKLDGDYLYAGKPFVTNSNFTRSVFKLNEDGKAATRVVVNFGKGSANTVEIISGLNEGDRIILSDMSAFDGADTIKLR